MIIVEQLTKTFGNFTAVDALDLRVARGECFRLLGSNGAEKSTFIGMIYGAIRRDSATLRVFGSDPEESARETKRRPGVVTQDNALDESLTVRENVLLYAAFVGVPRAEREPRVCEVIGYMNLEHKADTKIIALSGGMKRRQVFVRALLNNPSS
jgi:lipooligosaccharide transport system ATP-binding protein